MEEKEEEDWWLTQLLGIKPQLVSAQSVGEEIIQMKGNKGVK